MAERIVQIIPAEGWCALFQEEHHISKIPLVCFALVERQDENGIETEVKGMESGAEKKVSFSDEAGNFVGYWKEGNLESFKAIESNLKER
jgi:hypothetical protein